MKIWLGTTVFEATQEQLDTINDVAEKAYMATADRSKGLQAAIDWCRKEGLKVVRQVHVMKSKSGEALPEMSYADVLKLVEEAVKTTLADVMPKAPEKEEALSKEDIVKLIQQTIKESLTPPTVQ